MSYGMTHLLIANQYAIRHNIKEEELGMFLLASICPDSIHARENCNFQMKERSHFLPEGIVWGTIYEEEPMNRWYDELRRAYGIRSNLQLTNMERAFLNGYTLHILTDIFNCQKLYAPNLILHGLDVDNFRREYRRQCMNFDHYLYQNCHDSEHLFQSIKTAAMEIINSDLLKNLVLQEVVNSKDIYKMVIDTEKQYQEAEEATLENMYMITEKSSMDFIKQVGKQCDELLFQFPVVKGLFEVTLS